MICKTWVFTCISNNSFSVSDCKPVQRPKCDGNIKPQEANAGSVDVLVVRSNAKKTPQKQSFYYLPMINSMCVSLHEIFLFKGL